MERYTLDPSEVSEPLAAQVAALTRAVNYLTDTVELQRVEIMRLQRELERLQSRD